MSKLIWTGTIHHFLFCCEEVMRIYLQYSFCSDLMLVLCLIFPFPPFSCGFQFQLRKVSLSEDDAFTFLKGDNYADSSVTYFSFSEALRQVLHIV